MAALETSLIIRGVDDTSKAFASVEAKIKGLSRQVGMAGTAIGVMGSRIGSTAGAARGFGGLGVGGGLMGSMVGSIASTAAMIGAGMAVREGVKAIAARQHEIVRMSVAGMDPSEIADATLQASKLTAEMPSVSMVDTLHMLRNARSIVGTYAEAAELAKPLMKLRTLVQLAHPGQDVSEDFDMLMKAMEIKGITQNPKRFAADIDLVAKAISVFGDTLKPAEYFEMVQHARQAAVGLSDKFLFTVGPTLAQEMKGSSFGTGLAGFNRLVVAGIGKKGSFQEMARLGLIGRGGLADMPGSGEGHGLRTGRTVEGWRVAQKDPYEWVRDYLIPAFDRAGIKGLADQMREIAVLFPQVSGQLVSILATQQPRIEKDRALEGKAAGLDAADKAMREDPALAWQGLKSATENWVATAFQSLNMAGPMTDLAQAIALNTLALEAETQAQNAGKPSPAIDDMNRSLNRRIFGVDTPDVYEAEDLSQRSHDDVAYRDKVHDWLKRSDQLFETGGSEADKAALSKEAAAGTAAWRDTLAPRGLADQGYAMTAALAARAEGRDAPFGPTGAAGVSQKDYVADAIRQAEARAFPQNVSVSGQADVQQTFFFDVSLDPDIRVQLDRFTSLAFSVPLGQAAPTGRMDDDAAPRRGGPH